MKMIRWSGLVGFVALVGLVIVLVIWLLPTIIKDQLEQRGGALVGAPVSVADVDITLHPLGIALFGVEIGDPKVPQINLLAFSQASIDVDLMKLLQGQRIFNQLSVLNLTFSSPRSSAAAVIPIQAQAPVESSSPDATDASSLASFSGTLPSADEILNQEQLVTDQRLKEWQQLWSEQRAMDAKLRAELPDSTKLADYQTRLSALKAQKPQSLQEYQQALATLKTLKQELSHDRAALAAAKKSYGEGGRLLKQKLVQLKSAPGEDLDRLRSRYSLDASGAINLSRYIIGDQAQTILHQLLGYYQMVQPYLGKTEDAEDETTDGARSDGRYLHFATSEPLPTFLIRSAVISVDHALGNFDVGIADITHQHEILGRATTLNVDAKQLTGAETLQVRGQFDTRGEQGIKSELEYQLKGLVIEPMQFGGGSLPLEIAGARSDLQGELTLVAEQLIGHNRGLVREVQFVSQHESSGWRGELNKVITAIDSFDFSADISGTVTNPRLQVKSDLDSRVSSIMKQRLAEQQRKLGNSLKTKLNQRLQSGVGDNEQQLQILLDGENSSSERLQQVETMMTERLADYKDQQVQKAQDKAKQQAEQQLKDKLKSKFNF